MKKTEFHSPASDGAGEPQELQRCVLDHLHNGHWPASSDASEAQYLRAAAPQGSLPYELLEPKAFERLCFHLLLAAGKNVRFWGRHGQAQHGIDLLMSDGTASSVYQCKHTANFGAADLETALKKFQTDWLGRTELGRPDQFVLCTSAVITDTIEWEDTKRKASKAMGVAVEEWHRGTLDAALRTQPNIVAELFGERVALAYCGAAAAAGQDLFRTVCPGSDPRIDQFFQLRASGRLVPFDTDLQAWREVLERHGLVMLGGMAGTGKTVGALTLTAELQLGGWRAFFLRADVSRDVDALTAGLRARAFRPTIIVIDDCHKALDAVERLVYRISPSSANLRIVLTGRSAPADADLMTPDSTAWLARLEEQGQLFTLKVDAQCALMVMHARDPAWGRSAGQLLLKWSGHDLAVLSLLLDTLRPDDVHGTDALQSQFPRLLQVFFDGARTANAPELRKLAAVAQFDIDVPADLFPEPLETGRNTVAVERLVLAVGRPRSLAFAHPSAAELVHALLCWAGGETDSAGAAADDCVEVLKRAVGRFEPAVWCDAMLGSMLRTRLKLSDGGNLMQQVLNSPDIVAALCGLPAQPSMTRSLLLNNAAYRCRGTAAAGRYSSALSLGIEATVRATGPTEHPGLGLLPIFIRTLGLCDTGAREAMEARIGTAAMAQAIGTRASVVELIKGLPYFSTDFAVGLLLEFSPDAMTALVDRTLAMEDKSLGTLNLALRDLKVITVPGATGRTLLTLFEERLGAPAMARLIARHGSVVELLRGLPHFSREFAAQLLQEFSPEAMTALVDRTLAMEGKSIGTLNLVLRDLKVISAPGAGGQTLLTLFEAQLGAPAMARLIARHGSVVELLKGLPHFSGDFAASLLRNFSPDGMAKLVDRTLAMGDKSIGTMNLALRDLKVIAVPGGAGQTLLTLFEAQVGAPAIARLIARLGSVVDLLKALPHFSGTFAAQLLQEFSPDAMAALVNRTLAMDDKSIGTLNLVVRDLSVIAAPGEASQTLRTLFEARLGPSAFWRWMQARGNLHHMSYLVAELTPGFRALAFGLTHLPAAEVWRTVARRGSIYSLATFAAEALPLLPEACRNAIEQVAQELAQSLTQASKWSELGSAQAKLERIASGDPLHSLLSEAIQARVRSVEVRSMFGQGFEEACHSLQVLWWSREELRAEIGQRLWHWLPDESTWPLDYRLLHNGRFALAVARTSWVSDDDASRVLRAFAPLSDRVVIDPKAARQHATFLWNLHALWIERGQSNAAHFEDLQSATTWQRFTDVIRQRAAWGDNLQKLDTLMLAGALATWLPSVRGDIQTTLRGQLRGAKFLLEWLDKRDLPFVQGWLISQGLTMLMSPSSVYPPKRIDHLLAKLEDYPEQGLALSEVRATLLKGRGIEVAGPPSEQPAPGKLAPPGR